MLVNFNLQNTQEYKGSIPVLPAGDYVVKIVDETPNQPLKNGSGTALVFEYQVVDGPFVGSRIRDWLNLGHADEQTRGLAQSRLKSIGVSCGLPIFNDTRELFNRPFVVRLSCSEYQGKQRNNIDEYRPVAQGQPVQAAPTQPTQPSQPQPVQPAGAFWK